jgi:hypothetical protein
MMYRLIGPIALLAAALGFSSSAQAGFSAKVDNPWFPLKPGTTLTYKGVKDGRSQRDVFRVTAETKTVDGAPCVVVDDRVYTRGHLAERTSDYYTQDGKGNVWYYGEDTAELNAGGHVTTREGTWHAGVKGAKPGVFMPAHPRVGQSGFQEFWKGHAEDHFSILSTRAAVTVPYGSFTHAIRTRETSPLEPGVVDNKYYVRGIGQVFEGSVKGPKETARLVSITRG